MKIKFNVNKELKDQLILEKLKKVLFDSMIKMHELAVLYCPVDTSRLVNSINIFPQYFGAIKYTISDGVDYGIHQEFGTFKMDAQPFFRPALTQVKQIWIKRFMNKEFG